MHWRAERSRVPLRPLIRTLIRPLVRALACALLLWTAPAAWAESPLDDLIPLGFGGLELGAEFASLERGSMTPTRTIHVESMLDGEYDVLLYSLQGQDMTLAKARLDSVEYGFCDGYLCAVLATATGADNYRLLRDHLVATYGTDERAAFAYDTVWDRLYREESEDQITTHLWILCERQTDNCALARLIWQERIGRATLNIGDQMDTD